MIHPVLTFGPPVRVRRMGSAVELPLSELDGEGDLVCCSRGILTNGEIWIFAPGDDVVESVRVCAMRVAQMI